MPTPTLAHLNSDQLLDIAYINAGANGLGQMNIHFQQTSGSESKPTGRAIWIQAASCS